uniref:Uncharacterized protein n=1 Tax=Amphimedon queenslandica TaxID=400682 RepID=A0A1X7V3C7_AMPQE
MINMIVVMMKYYHQTLTLMMTWPLWMSLIFMYNNSVLIQCFYNAC